MSLFGRFRKGILAGLAELLIIFVGITASLVIDDWRSESDDDATAQMYLRGLYNDITQDMITLRILGEDEINKRNKATQLLEAMHNPDSLPLEDKEFKDKFGLVTRLDKFVSSDNTFRDLTSTGNLRLMKDPQIKNSIFNYYREVEELRELQEINNKASAELTLKTITELFAVREVYVTGNPVFYQEDKVSYIDMKFFHNKFSEKFLGLEDLLLFRNIFLSMEVRKIMNIYKPLMDLRRKICVLTGIPDIEQFSYCVELMRIDPGLVFDWMKRENPELFFFEDELNVKAYEHLEAKSFENAFRFFQFIIVLFPESANAYDSMGEYYIAVGDVVNAEVNYKKSLEIDELNSSAIEALAKISAGKAK